MRLLVLNLKMDADDPVLGFATAWVNALARRCSQVTVVTMETGRIDVADNVSVHSLGREQGLSEPRRLRRLLALLERLTRRRAVDICFAHQAAILAAVAGPVVRARRIPLMLWYAHGHVPPALRVAERFAARCVTSTPAGFRLPSHKLHVLHQGIDVRRFAPPATGARDGTSTAVSVGRISPSKRTDDVIRAVAVARSKGSSVEADIFGGPATRSDRAYEGSLRGLIVEKGLEGAVRLRGPLGYTQVASAYAGAACFLSLSAVGSLDKTLLEAMASGCIPLSSNESFARLATEAGLEDLVCEPSPAALAERVLWFEGLSDSDRAALRARCRKLVQDAHSLDRLADRLYAEMDALASRGPT